MNTLNEVVAKKYIAGNATARNKCTLMKANKLRHDWFLAIYKDSSNDLVNFICELYRPD